MAGLASIGDELDFVRLYWIVLDLDQIGLGWKWIGLYRVGLDWVGFRFDSIDILVGCDLLTFRLHQNCVRLKLSSIVLDLDRTRLDFACIGLGSMWIRLDSTGLDRSWIGLDFLCIGLD